MRTYFVFQRRELTFIDTYNFKKTSIFGNGNCLKKSTLTKIHLHHHIVDVSSESPSFTLLLSEVNIFAQFATPAFRHYEV